MWRIFCVEIPFRSVLGTNKYRFSNSFTPNNLPQTRLCPPPRINPKLKKMALKAVHVSDVPNLDQVPENASLSLCPSRFSQGVEVGRSAFRAPKFLVVGHRGSGMNMLQSMDKRMRAIKENSILSFNAASKFPIDFVEFDVQVTSDDCPVIFHDNFIFYEDTNGCLFEKRVTELCLAEFLAYGPQREAGKAGKTLVRKMKDGRIVSWDVEVDDSMCTLQDAFEQVEPSIGFNIELKFDDHIGYQQDHLTRVLQAILRVVSDSANQRPVIFSTFQPDAALLVRQLQDTYPVFFLTNGGNEVYEDVRRNTLEEAIKLCMEGGLQGIVSEVRGVFRNPGAVAKIKESKLSLLTYGKLNNVPEAVYLQHLMGVEGVIVDLVQEITEAVMKLIRPAKSEEEEEGGFSEEGDGVAVEVQAQAQVKPQFSQRELSFLLKLIPELLQL